MSKLPEDVTFDSLLAAYDDGMYSKLELYYLLLIRAEGEDVNDYLERIPAEHRAGFAKAIEEYPLDGTGIDLGPGFDPPPDSVVRSLQAALVTKWGIRYVEEERIYKGSIRDASVSPEHGIE